MMIDNTQIILSSCNIILDVLIDVKPEDNTNNRLKVEIKLVGTPKQIASLQFRRQRVATCVY